MSRFVFVDKIIENIITIHKHLKKYDIVTYVYKDELITKNNKKYKIEIKYERVK